MNEEDEIVELPEAIRRIEMFFNENREPVDSASNAVFKNVTIYDEDGNKTDSYSVDIIDGVDQEYVEKKRSDEGFNEEEHPRDNDGVFVDKTGQSDSQSKAIRDRIFDREIAKNDRRIGKLNERIPKIQAMIDDPNYKPTNDMDTKDYLEYSVQRMEKNIIKYEELKVNAIKMSAEQKEKYDGLDLLEITGIGKNTHKKGSRGFKNGVAKSIMKDWKLEMRKGTFLTKRENERYDEDNEHEDRLISIKAWDDRFKGRTLIDSNIPETDDSVRGDMQNEIMYFWNEVMTDDQRSGVDVLKIYWSDNPQYTTRSDGVVERTLGTHSSRKGYTRGEDESKSEVLLAPSILTINLAHGDNIDDVLHTMIHEKSHNQWSNNVKNNHTKVNKFTEKVLALGKEGAITSYAGSFFDDLDKVHREYDNKWEEEVANTKKMYGKNDVQTQAEYETWRDQAVIDRLVNRHKTAKADIRENIAKVERLIANETHSEYFAMVSAPTDRDYHTVDTVKLQAFSKLIKEGLYD